MLFKPKSGLWFAPNTDNATGTPPAAQPPAELNGNGSNGGNANPQTDPPASQAKPPITFESEEKLQKFIESQLEERLERARKKAEKEAQAAREQAAADAAAKNGEWEKLAVQREGKIKELTAQVETITPLQEKADKYEKALKSYLETQRIGLPNHVLVLLDKLDPAEQLEYIATNHDALVTPTATQAQPRKTNGVPPTPPAGNPGEMTAEQMAQGRQAQAALVHSNF